MYRKNQVFFLIYKRTWPGPGGVVFCRGAGAVWSLDERRKLTQKGLAFWAVVGRVTDKQ